MLLEGEEGSFDLGKANDRYFLLMCGIGFDASIVRKVPSQSKRLLGSTSYVLWGVAEVARYRSKVVRIRLGGDEEQEIDLYWLLLGNTRSYGGVLNIAHEAIADDGLLDAYLFAGSRIPITTAARTGGAAAGRRPRCLVPAHPGAGGAHAGHPGAGRRRVLRRDADDFLGSGQSLDDPDAAGAGAAAADAADVVVAGAGGAAAGGGGAGVDAVGVVPPRRRVDDSSISPDGEARLRSFVRMTKTRRLLVA